MPQWLMNILHAINSALFSLYLALSATPDAALAFDRKLWNVSRLLSAAIYVAIAAAAVFICYMIFRHRKK